MDKPYEDIKRKKFSLGEIMKKRSGHLSTSKKSPNASNPSIRTSQTEIPQAENFPRSAEKRENPALNPSQPTPRVLKPHPPARPMPTNLKQKADKAAKGSIGMDFEAYRKQKKRELAQKKRLAQTGEKKAENERYHLKKGVCGGGSKYQDQRIGNGPPQSVNLDSNKGKKYQDQKLGQGINKKYRHPAGQEKTYQDHRLGNGIDPDIVSITDGQGEKYQDHRYGNALAQDFLDISAGQGAKYQDHRLGKGISDKDCKS